MSCTGAGRKPFGPADALLLALILFWGANSTVIKVAHTRLSPLVCNAARFLLATATVLGIVSATGANLPLPARLRWQGALLGILRNTVYQLCFIEGLTRTSLAHAPLIQASMPLAAVMLTRLAPPVGRNDSQREVLACRRDCPPLGTTQAGRFSGGKRPGLF